MPNNPNTDSVVLNALATIAVGYPSVNTNVGTYGATYVQQTYKLIESVFPAILLTAGPQTYTRVSQKTFAGTLEAIIEYYDKYDQNTQNIDDVRANIASDLEKIKSNIESNDTLTHGATTYTLSTNKYTLSPYRGEIDTTTIPGITLVCRKLQVTFNLLDYDV